MQTQAIDNANLLNLVDQGLGTFNPSITFALSGSNVTVTDGSTMNSGDTLKKIHVRLLDEFGGEVRDVITVTGAPGQKVLSSSTLNTSRGLRLTATIITNAGIVADGNAVGLGASGSLSNWDKQKNA